MTQFNNLPTYTVPLLVGRNTSKDWYLFFAGLFQGLPPGNVQDVTLTASPFEFTAPSSGFVIVRGGTVSLIEFSRDGVSYYPVGATSGSFTLASADRLRVTYSVAPTITFVPT